MKELNEAKVLAVGPGGLDREGKRIAPSVAPGDKVLIPQVWIPTYIICVCIDLTTGSIVWRKSSEGRR